MEQNYIKLILLSLIILTIFIVILSYRETSTVETFNSYLVQPIFDLFKHNNSSVNNEVYLEHVQPSNTHTVEEGFNNDLVKDDVDITSYNNYESALKEMALENGVAEQHQKFVSELHHRVGGTSSRSPVRDDNVDEIPWVGLKRPQYKQINPNRAGATTIPSVIDSDQLADYKHISWA